MIRSDGGGVSTRARERWAVGLRRAAIYLTLLLLLAVATPSPLGVTLGFMIAASGQALRLWAAGHLRKTTELATSGPYRYTRNPLYLGRLVIFSGLVVMARLPGHLSWLLLGLGYALFFSYYLRRKERVESARLRAVHGETYERYHDAVPALFPTLHPYPAGGEIGWSSVRMLRNREHWMLLGLLLSTLYLLFRAYRV